MEKYKEIKGDLIELALAGSFDVITHGVNCFSNMGAGIAPKMAKAFNCDLFDLEYEAYKGNINKLGQIDAELVGALWVVNSYTQYNYGKNHEDGDAMPLDYSALRLCLKKINHTFKGKHIGLPKIGCGLAGGNWGVVSEMIKKELKDMQVTVVIYNGS